MSRRHRIVLDVVPAPATDLPGLLAPVTIIPIEVEEGRKVFVFQIAGDERKLLEDVQVRSIAQAVGNLVHPAQSVLVITPAGATLTAHEVRVKGAR